MRLRRDGSLGRYPRVWVFSSCPRIWRLGTMSLRLVVYDDKTQTPTVQVGIWQPEVTLARLQVKAGTP